MAYVNVYLLIHIHIFCVRENIFEKYFCGAEFVDG